MRANLLQANALSIPLADESVQTCVTSPPYFGLRDYGVGKQLGLEPTLQEYIENICKVFDEVWRVLRPDGTLWLNMGDSYNGSGGAGGDYNEGGLKEGQPRYPGRNEAILKPKDLMGVPWRVAFALQERGWWLRSDIIWHKPNPMPESVTDRPTKSHEYIFLLTKNGPAFKWVHRDTRECVYSQPKPDYRWVNGENQEIDYAPEGWPETKEWERINLWNGHSYYYDADAIREAQSPGTFDRYRPGEEIPSFNKEGGSDRKTRQFAASTPMAILPNGRNKRTVWTVTTKPYSGAHFATFPPDLIEPCILAGSKEGDYVLDPFGGSGTTAMVAQQHNRVGICLDLSWEYLQLARERCGLKQMQEFYEGRKAEANWQDLPLFQP